MNVVLLLTFSSSSFRDLHPLLPSTRVVGRDDPLSRVVASPCTHSIVLRHPLRPRPFSFCLTLSISVRTCLPFSPTHSMLPFLFLAAFSSVSASDHLQPGYGYVGPACAVVVGLSMFSRFLLPHFLQLTLVSGSNRYFTYFLVFPKSSLLFDCQDKQ